MRDRMAWWRRNGLDDRFMLFVFGTMVLAVVAVGLAGAASWLFRQRPDEALGVFVTVLIGGGIAIVPLFLAGVLPSAVTFAVVYRLTGGEARKPSSAVWAGIATAVVATLWTLFLIMMGWRRIDTDGAAGLIGVTGIAAMIVAPLAARWAYPQLPDRHGANEIWTGE